MDGNPDPDEEGSPSKMKRVRFEEDGVEGVQEGGEEPPTDPEAIEAENEDEENVEDEEDVEDEEAEDEEESEEDEEDVETVPGGAYLRFLETFGPERPCLPKKEVYQESWPKLGFVLQKILRVTGVSLYNGRRLITVITTEEKEEFCSYELLDGEGKRLVEHFLQQARVPSPQRDVGFR